MATHTGSEGTVRVGATNSVLEIRSYSVEETADRQLAKVVDRKKRAAETRLRRKADRA